MKNASITLILCCCCYASHSQEKDTLSYAAQLALLESEMDSLSIFHLIDSLFFLDATPESELTLRFNASSSVTSAGRDYNFDQKGLSPGISYYHKSGFYGDLSGYWSSTLAPAYNPTIVGMGYLGTLSQQLSYSLDYERSFFNPKDTSANPLTNALGASINYDFKVGYLSVDYSYLFGTSSAHRIIGSLTGTLPLGKWWKFNSISLYPSASILYGNGEVTTLRITSRSFGEALTERIANIRTFENLSSRQRLSLRRIIVASYQSGTITEAAGRSLISKTVTNQPLTDGDLATLNVIAKEGRSDLNYELESKFGLLNYAFTLPLSLTTKRLSLILSYTYSVPVTLPGEALLALGPIGYFSFSAAYRIRLNNE